MAFAILAVAACGGGVETSGTGGNTTTTTSGNGGAVVGFPNDCASDGDCSGGACVEMTAGGFKICLSPPPEATACNVSGPVPDQCCKTMDCQGGGKCYLSASVPNCGGVPAPDYNFCAGDACKADSDCQGAGVNQICAPAGAFGQPGKACVNAYCKTDAECGAKPGGRCAPVMQTCCGLPAGLACVYSGGCREDQDCANDGSQHCEIDPTSHEGTCVNGFAACPA